MRFIYFMFFVVFSVKACVSCYHTKKATTVHCAPAAGKKAVLPTAHAIRSVNHSVNK